MADPQISQIRINETDHVLEIDVRESDGSTRTDTITTDDGAGGAPADADYLVGTTNAGLSGEIVVGTTPGGELGGTWASPTVDASHSGSTHAAVQAAAEATAASALATHEADTTNIHGITDTAALVTTTSVVELAQDAVGAMIADTATIDLTYTDATPELKGDVINASITNAKLANMAQATFKGRAAAAGTGDPVDLTATQARTILDSNTTPSTQAFSDAAAVGTADTFARGDHKHAMPALGTGATNACAGNDSRLSDSRAPSGSAGGVLSGTYPNPGFAADMATQAELDAHTGDSSAAHAASAISADSTTLVGTGTDVQAVLEELDDGIADHLADSSAAHAASAISFSATGNIASTDVQAAIAEVDTEKVATNRQVISGGGLTGGGDLSTDRTLAVGAGTGITVNADDVEVTSGKGFYGDGSDGTVAFDGTNTFAFASTTGAAPNLVYTLTRDIFAATLTVSATKIVNAPYRIFCTGTLTNSGTIRHNGGDGTGVTAGAATVQGAWSLGSIGGAGIASGTTTVVGNGGAACGSATALLTKGATGGAGGNSNGGAGGVITALQAQATGHLNSVNAAQGVVMSSGNAANKGPTLAAFYGGSGGGGGGRTTGGTATTSGAGGGGGGVLVICARKIVNTGATISANGGNGGNAAGGTCVTGGGGGGGGGFLVMIYDTLATGTEQAAGGTKGTGLNGAAAASDGGTGTVLKIVNV